MAQAVHQEAQEGDRKERRMNVKTLIGLIIVSVVAISVDCYAAYYLFMMTAMPIMHYLSPFLLLFLIVSVPLLFIASIIGLFWLKKWAYWTFLVMTALLHSFLIYLFIFFLTINASEALEMRYLFPVISFLVFVIYFLRPSVRKSFN